MIIYFILFKTILYYKFINMDNTIIPYTDENNISSEFNYKYL